VPAAPSGTSVIEREVRIEASPEIVFSFFTDPEKMVRWMGRGATLDPRPGGIFSVKFPEPFFVEGKYLEVEPYVRVVFSWGYGDVADVPDSPLPPGASVVEVDFVAEGDATIVRLTHRLPALVRDFHVLGWDNYLGRLGVVAAGGDPGADPFVAVAEELRGE
jgi:uncharacterized protein YndB with AHSA1/START domain